MSNTRIKTNTVINSGGDPEGGSGVGVIVVVVVGLAVIVVGS